MDASIEPGAPRGSPPVVATRTADEVAARLIALMRATEAGSLEWRRAEFARQKARVETGRFGAHMRVSLVNDGPVTFWLQIRPGS